MTNEQFDAQQQFFDNTSPEKVEPSDFPAQHFLDQMPRRYYNPGEGMEHDRIQECLDAGMVVVNAPRGLPGEVMWESSFLTGIYWAAGLPSTARIQHWYRHGATIVDLVTNDQVVEIAKVEYEIKYRAVPEIRKRSWDEMLERHGLKTCIECTNRDLPYRE